MAKVLSSISLDAPASPVTADVTDTFEFSGTPSFTGSGGVQRYDFKWEVDDGGGYVTIASSGTGLITAGTNPVTNSNSQAQQSITVTCDEAGSYTIRMAGAPSTGGSYTVLSATQTVTVSAATDNLLAEDVQSTSELTSPAIAQVHAITANDVESSSEVSAPAIALVTPLTADDIQSTSEVGSPSVGQTHVILANDVQSTAEVSVPSLSQAHVLLVVHVESVSEISSPSIAQIHALTVVYVGSMSEVSVPVLGVDGGEGGGGSAVVAGAPVFIAAPVRPRREKVNRRVGRRRSGITRKNRR